MQGWHLNLQTYAIATTYDEAFAVASALVSVVGPIAGIQDCTVRPYPKFDDQFGIRLTLTAPNLDEAYGALLASLASDWVIKDLEEEASATWDARTNGPCPLEDMRWMHLNLFLLTDD